MAYQFLAMASLLLCELLDLEPMVAPDADDAPLPDEDERLPEGDTQLLVPWRTKERVCIPEAKNAIKI